MERFILRAEIQTTGETIISYGYDLDPDSVFVVTEWHAPVGTKVTVRLSLPRMIEPVELGAAVGGLRAPGAPGELGGVVLAFEPEAPRAGLEGILAAARAATSDPAPAYRALLVEDNGLTRDVVDYSAGRYFAAAPGAVAIEHADSAERAWELLEAGPYDVVIVDYFLPTSDGAALIARLRADPRLRGIPIVAISAGGRAAREATLLAGADLFMDKPLALADLFHTLQILAHVAPAGSAKRTILVLDDSPLALAVTRAALEAAGFAVAIAEDLSTFERQRASCDPDLIIIDVQMPEAYGDDVAATLVGGKHVDVPVVLFSSIDEQELARRSEAAHATGYIWKGAGMTELVRRCKELLA